jgi:hypothetical protein
MGKELDRQNAMLPVLDRKIDKTSDKIEKVSKMLKK